MIEITLTEFTLMALAFLLAISSATTVFLLGCITDAIKDLSEVINKKFRDVDII